MATIDALFGSKTRVKLLHLFMNNPEKSFYVREITRLVDEQINSVRRELSNMLAIGIITSDTSDNKLYYAVNREYEHFVPLRDIFVDSSKRAVRNDIFLQNDWKGYFNSISGIRIAIAAGLLVRGSTSKVDLLVVGSVAMNKLKKAIASIEQSEGCELNYSVISYEDFYYRLSIRDKFITEILNTKHSVFIDIDNVLNELK